LYDQFVPGFVGNFLSGGGIMSPACRNAVKTQLSVLQCPSDPSVQQLSTQQFQWQGIPVAVTSYKGVMGDCQIGGGMSAWQGTTPPSEGFPGLNGIFYRADCQDGGISIAKIRDGTSNTLMVGEDVPEHNHHSVAYYSKGDYASCDGPINYMPDPPTPDNYWNVMTFRSRHPGGANFSLADGSLHFLSQTIDQTLYRALSTKAGGEPVQVP
jgi:prepilin-type processing-associated H-X9-DG protein